MPIKNYTTKVSANRSIQEIQTSLVQHGATGFALKYEQNTGRIEELRFVLSLEGRDISFALPVNWRLFQNVLKEQEIKKCNDDDYCYRVAWRNIRDWILAQMALYETRMVSIPQIFLPYAITKDGKTLFETIAEDPQLLLN